MTVTLLAPLSGVIVPLDKVPDAVFSKRIVGDGISVDPLSSELLAPCDGRIIQVHRAGHAVTLSAHGLEIVIHIGLDTVNLKGEGFSPRVHANTEVRAGDPLISFDADLVARKARSLLTQIIVSNMDAVATMKPGSGRVVAGRDVVLWVDVRGDVSSESHPGEVADSGVIVIANEHGLHARPAALIASAAKRYDADVRLLKGDREANARSVVSIMELEVLGGDAVRVVAGGADARAAITEIRQILQQPMLHAATAPASAKVQPEPAVSVQAGGDGIYRGVSASNAVAIGNAFQLRYDEAVVGERGSEPTHERRALDSAIAAARAQLEALRLRMAEEADAERAAIFAAHEELLSDPELLEATDAQIGAGASAAHAWRNVYSAQAERLRSLGNPLFSARAADLRDVGRRVLHLLVGRDETPLEIPSDCIIIAEDLTPSEAASLDRARVRGFCTTLGSATSHVAILAQALGIPAVVGMDPHVLDIANGTRVILDGGAGTVRVSPTEAQVADARLQQQRAAQRRAQDVAEATTPAVTRDGHRVHVVANIGDVSEAGQVVAAGGEGVGLLRTEFLFMDRHSAPDEDEQSKIYESIARSIGKQRALVIRTLDVGGDKPLSYLTVALESNPFLGERGIRLTLGQPEIMRSQIRAILRASAHARVAMMFPMIATLAEWRIAREMVAAETKEMAAAPIPVGIMVETAAAALLAERFAAEADFFSIGTNDLTQYTLAMDRTHPRLAPQVDALHPAVLHLIERTVAGARAHNRPVAVCGALAGDPVAVPVLLGLGVTELSVSVPAIATVKARIRTLSIDKCRTTAQAAMAAGDAEEVRALVAQHHGDGA